MSVCLCVCAVRDELRGEYEGIVKDLTLQIQTLHSNFAEYKTHLYQDVLSSLVRICCFVVVQCPSFVLLSLHVIVVFPGFAFLYSCC